MEHRANNRKLYASRNQNFNLLRHSHSAPAANRSQADWCSGLRHGRRRAKPDNKGGDAVSSQTAEFGESERRKREPLAPGHPDGAYQCERPTLGKYQNFSNTSHMLTRLKRVSSGGGAHSIDWQLNLRGGLHQNEFNTSWSRHHIRSRQTFERMREECRHKDQVARERPWTAPAKR
eukprot:TRINITY_DN63126_c0_g1_i1.p1 TRINITY_DN63126_c0_g1~~TRINITY_DN63126_c0_g1_i1.p1  ORF type:complete len:200 (-),score=15.31 TRINITY_DN63126_c0_g1_i1:7-534(-)